ncbi:MULTISPECIES: DUF922 domain-containing Zn-dependent protease [unclassified Sinorhizobium]|uniref:DUF922 domain-containing Zn-dependent protease n=1 Tax=unclassified Sinorhizobium TaxID=2613772 RepID=UPI0035235692
MLSASRYVRVLLAIPLSLGICGPAASEVVVRNSYSYFDIRGKTADDLDRELAKHGPSTQGNDNRHPGATRIRFGGDVTYAQRGGWCYVANVRVTVDTQIIMPRWRNRRNAEKDLSIVWDTLASDIKRHEEHHAEIARNHARAMEKEIRKLRPQRSCETLQRKVADESTQAIAAHDRDQARFDRVEAVNFQNRMTRLLYYRIRPRTGGE